MYSKLFTSMYDGSLATIGPWEALVTFQQMVILATKGGVVDMTREAIARRTTIPLPIIKKGIEILELPDPESRREDNDGCRIVRLADHRDWGWIITNYEYYAALRNSDERASYQRKKYLERKEKAGKSTSCKKDSTNSTSFNNSTDSTSYLNLKTDLKTDLKKEKSLQKDSKEKEDFHVFWEIYPRKEAKKDAIKAWNKISPENGTVELILDAVNRQLKMPGWQKEDGKYIPLPASWLNGRRWEDEGIVLPEVTPDPKKPKFVC